MEEKEVCEGEIVENKQEEKKEGKIKGFFKKAKSHLDDATLDYKIKSEFEHNHKEYTIYDGTGLLNATNVTIYCEEHLDLGYVIAYGSLEDYKDALLFNEETKESYYIDKMEEACLNVTYLENTYEKVGTKISFSVKGKKVHVIKANNEFYLAKDEALK